MSTVLLARVVLIWFAATALSCSSKKADDPTPTPEPPLDISGTWDLTTQVNKEYAADGSVLTNNTYQYVGTGQDWSRIFKADKTFDYVYQGQSLLTGTYAITDKSVTLTNKPGTGSTPTSTFLIDKLTATGLVLIADRRTGAAGIVSTQTYIRH